MCSASGPNISAHAFGRVINPIVFGTFLESRAIGSLSEKSRRCNRTRRLRLKYPYDISSKIKAVEVHHLAPGGDEVLHELLLALLAGVHLGNGSKL